MPRFLQYIGSWFGFGANGTPVTTFPQTPAEMLATAGPICEVEATGGPDPIPETSLEIAAAVADSQTPQGQDLWLAFLRQGPDGFRDALAFCSETVLVEALQRLNLHAELLLAGRGGDPIVVLEMESRFGELLLGHLPADEPRQGLYDGFVHPVVEVEGT